MESGRRKGGKEVIQFFLIVLIVGGGIVYGVNELSKITCYEIAKKLEIKSEYSFFTGCIVEKNGRKYLLEQYRNIEIQNDLPAD